MAKLPTKTKKASTVKSTKPPAKKNKSSSKPRTVVKPQVSGSVLALDDPPPQPCSCCMQLGTHMNRLMNFLTQLASAPSGCVLTTEDGEIVLISPTGVASYLRLDPMGSGFPHWNPEE